ncbi:hypothetical protein AND_001451 [Anopheles darlingi]|uniref:DH domain-containing protein n=1 Tax=Anopheles darlingi TaxID=43151 RepID=W5JQS4_ANODA|nr:hypothetical protein AND_001451 [Anopheles darlingi]
MQLGSLLPLAIRFAVTIGKRRGRYARINKTTENLCWWSKSVPPGVAAGFCWWIKDALPYDIDARRAELSVYLHYWRDSIDEPPGPIQRDSDISTPASPSSDLRANGAHRGAAVALVADPTVLPGLDSTAMSISSSAASSTPEMTRICLVGPVAQDAATVAAAQTLNLPIVTSETGAEYLEPDDDEGGGGGGAGDDGLNTVFVVNDFEGPIYDAIFRAKKSSSPAVNVSSAGLPRNACKLAPASKQRTAGQGKGILGPPALQQAVRSKDGLVAKNRPVYNYCMRGVISCFTGIRKKDELLGQKFEGENVTFTIANQKAEPRAGINGMALEGGGKNPKPKRARCFALAMIGSQGSIKTYATTFRLAIIHPSWVTEAWERRHDPEFSATTKEFTDRHRVKAFDGYKVCFFGFQEDEKQHMIDVLQSNGGCPTELEDPDCTHVGDVVEGVLRKNAEPEKGRQLQSLNADVMEDEQQQQNEDNVEKDRNNGGLPVLPEENESQDGVGQNRIVGTSCTDHRPRHGGEHLMSIAENDNNHNQCAERSFTRTTRPIVAAPTMQYIDEEETEASADGGAGRLAETPRQDGVVLTSGEANQFLDPNNLSPILKSGAPVGGRAVGTSVDESFYRNNDDHQQRQSTRDGASVNNGQQDEDDDDHDDDEDMDDYVIASREAYKRKRPEDSFDDQSMLSVDISIASTVMYGGGGGGTCAGGSAKKPKLTRTGSISRGIRRSMSFVTMTPIKSMFRSRRNSVDPNASITSINSVDTTFNESIKKPVKEKLRSIRDKITKGGRKDTPKTIKSRSGLITSTNLDNLKKVCNFKTTVPEKGPQTPEKSKQERTEMVTRSRGKLTSAATSFNLHQRHSIATTPGSLATVAPVAAAVEEEMDTDECNTIAANSTMLIDDGPVVATVTAGGDADMIPVVDEHVVQTKPETKNKNTHIVKADWFWYTIQAGYANEVDYLFADYLESIAHTPAVDRRDSLPVSFNKRKRKRLSQRTPAEGGTPISIGKRRSSVSDAGLLSVSGSFLDCTTSPDKHEASKKNVISEVAEASMEQPSAKTQSMRHNHFMDFFHTESNYVGILDTIVKLFKEPLEEMVESENALLNKSELRSIFGNFLPIHDVHKRMLARLQAIHGHWAEEVLIGQIVLDHRDDLLKAYPPYVNFFEQMKETLVQCDASNPRFHAFLKINQAKPECGRQSLQDLMIRPVQRLPSISLLLNDILKHTPKGNPDSRKLDEALKAIKEVMTYINEDKRKTEGQMALFDIFNDIDNCPVSEAVDGRLEGLCLILKSPEVTELSDSLSGRGDPLVLFLFNDTLEVCKKRSRVFHNAKSPNTNTLNLARSSCATTKPYKHLKLMPLSTVRLVVNIEDSARAFMLNCRELAPNAKDRQYSFNMADEEQDKLVYLRTLSKQMAENACRTDAAHFLINRTAEEVDIDVSDINVGTLSKAFKFASKTRIRVGRAFSFNKTPSKLKRAVSTMMTSPFGSTQSLTPASQMAQMKLASCTNLNEVGEETGESKDGSPSSSTNVLVAPMSVQPTRVYHHIIKSAADTTVSWVAHMGKADPPLPGTLPGQQFSAGDLSDRTQQYRQAALFISQLRLCCAFSLLHTKRVLSGLIKFCVLCLNDNNNHNNANVLTKLQGLPKEGIQPTFEHTVLSWYSLYLGVVGSCPLKSLKPQAQVQQYTLSSYSIANRNHNLKRSKKPEEGQKMASYWRYALVWLMLLVTLFSVAQSASVATAVDDGHSQTNAEIDIDTEQKAAGFTVYDYVAVCAMLVISIGIGVFYGWFGKKKGADAEGGADSSGGDFLLGSGMSLFPVTLSLTTSFITAIELLGNPSEMFFNGTQFSLIVISMVLVVPVAVKVFYPIYYKLDVTSCYEYLGMRFDKRIRVFGAILYILQVAPSNKTGGCSGIMGIAYEMMLFYTSVAVLAPAIALSEATGLDRYIAVVLIYFVCIFYSSQGGMKAVVIADTFQILTEQQQAQSKNERSSPTPKNEDVATAIAEGMNTSDSVTEELPSSLSFNHFSGGSGGGSGELRWDVVSCPYDERFRVESPVSYSGPKACARDAAVVLLVSLVLILILGTHYSAGLSDVFSRASDHGRIEFFNFDPNPTTRHSVWSVIIGGFFYWTSMFCTNQASVQKCMSLKSLKTAKHALYLALLGLIAVFLMNFYTGLMTFAHYSECDPLAAGQITAKDQLLPFYVMDVFGHIKFMTGIFVAGIFAASLGESSEKVARVKKQLESMSSKTVAAALNSLAAVTSEDLLVSGMEWKIPQGKGALYAKWMSLGCSMVLKSSRIYGGGVGGQFHRRRREGEGAGLAQTLLAGLVETAGAGFDAKEGDPTQMEDGNEHSLRSALHHRGGRKGFVLESRRRLRNAAKPKMIQIICTGRGIFGLREKVRTKPDYQVFVVERLGGILQATLTLNGLIGGVTLGLFSLGILFRRANSKPIPIRSIPRDCSITSNSDPLQPGALYGGVTALLLVIVVGVLAQLNNEDPAPLPSSVAGCNATILGDAGNHPGLMYEVHPADGSSLALALSLEDDASGTATDLRQLWNSEAHDGSFYRHTRDAEEQSTDSSDESWFSSVLRISYMWYSCLGALLTMLFGIIISLIFGEEPLPTGCCCFGFGRRQPESPLPSGNGRISTVSGGVVASAGANDANGTEKRPSGKLNVGSMAPLALMMRTSVKFSPSAATTTDDSPARPYRTESRESFANAASLSSSVASILSIDQQTVSSELGSYTEPEQENRPGPGAVDPWKDCSGAPAHRPPTGNGNQLGTMLARKRSQGTFPKMVATQATNAHIRCTVSMPVSPTVLRLTDSNRERWLAASAGVTHRSVCRNIIAPMYRPCPLHF